MKKNLTILLLFLFICTSAWSQGKYIKTTTPCDNELLKKTPGRWMPISKGLDAKVSKSQGQEIVNRLNVIHQWVHNIYPSPMAFDALPSFSAYDEPFAMQLKMERVQDRLTGTPVNGIPAVSFQYHVGFCAYFCRNSYEIRRGAGCETGTNFTVSTNSFQLLLKQPYIDDFYGEIMRIDDRPIKMMGVLREKKWKGYDVYTAEGTSGYMVLLHRQGILPYIPVTRKQYLDRSIECLQKQYDKLRKSWGKPEGFALLMDKKDLEDQTKKAQKIWDDILKHYRDELDATTKAGLLDSPAVVNGVVSVAIQYPIFTTQAAGGRLLVTENPAYFRKDLPKHIPQLIIFRMWDKNDGPDPGLNPYKLYYENFPIEKLQAMIDK